MSDVARIASMESVRITDGIGGTCRGESIAGSGDQGIHVGAKTRRTDGVGGGVDHGDAGALATGRDGGHHLTPAHVRSEIPDAAGHRSEEHTSELQSLTRIS